MAWSRRKSAKEMKTSQFDAKTYGIGELITQRKLFRVPLHQRSYAWEQEAVTAFLEDIYDAYESRASDYFIGLVVVQGPENGEWILLDGQQRLTTASLIFAGIRYWLATNGFEDDAQQINHEYLGVRRLGGDYSSRMMLNSENQQAFSLAVVHLSTDSDLRKSTRGLPKRDSNRLLIDAALKCREWVSQIAGTESRGASALYDLARFLDSRVKVVCVDVSSEVDAFVLFESLNDRGVELSALDLIKNHIIGKVPNSEGSWATLTDALGDANPDDFLKVFWTSRYGVTQKSQIFRRVKELYAESSDARVLLDQLTTDADLLAAIGDDDHPIWADKRGIRDQVYILRHLGAKQARPVIISALRSFQQEEVQHLLWWVIVAIVRFQVIGKGRTGVVEKVFGKLCQAISGSTCSSMNEYVDLLDEMFLSNEDFTKSFASHIDSRYSRLAYLIAEVESQNQVREMEPGYRASSVRDILERSVLKQIVSAEEFPSEAGELVRLIGNYSVTGCGHPGDKEALGDVVGYVIGRSDYLADKAVFVWPLPYWRN